jgi:hypothetical protein
MSLLDLSDLVANLPPKCALMRAVHPDEWEWDLEAQLSALIVDSIRHHEWQSARLTPGVKGLSQNPPPPIPRPGVEPAEKKYGRDVLPMDEMAEWLGGPFAALNN